MHNLRSYNVHTALYCEGSNKRGAEIPSLCVRVVHVCIVQCQVGVSCASARPRPRARHMNIT